MVQWIIQPNFSLIKCHNIIRHIKQQGALCNAGWGQYYDALFHYLFALFPTLYCKEQGQYHEILNKYVESTFVKEVLNGQNKGYKQYWWNWHNTRITKDLKKQP